MTGNPIPFSRGEKRFMLTHWEPGPDHLSWAGIARELNVRYKRHNKGHRHRFSVRTWVLGYLKKRNQTTQGTP